jgi:hypothetical protein
MSLYKEDDVKFILSNMNSIMEKVKKKKLEVFEPKMEEKNAVLATIKKFIKDKKRKLYGGYAHHMLIVDKNPEDGFYSDLDFPDLDFYSPDPIKDLRELCNILFDKGFPLVEGKEAMHKETYSVFVNLDGPYCDISYVPKNIYDRMPFKEVSGFNIIAPIFASIDFLRIFSDPLTSWEIKLDAKIKRFYLLQKHYPFPHVEKPIKISFPEKTKKNIFTGLQEIHKFITNKDTILASGFYAYNHFINASGILTSKERFAQKFNYVQVPYYELISSDFRNDALALIAILKKVLPEKEIKTVEHYNFFQFLGNSVYIFHNDDLLAIMYTNNKKCVPYVQVPSNYYYNGKVETNKGKINICSFASNLVYVLSTIMKVRTDNDKETQDLYYTLLSHLVELRKYYLDKSNKNVLDAGIFSDFIIDCKGETMLPKREQHLRIKAKKAAKKQFKYSYNPETQRNSETPYFIFYNSSGNPIIKDKNLKLGDKPLPEDSDEVEEKPKDKNKETTDETTEEKSI